MLNVIMNKTMHSKLKESAVADPRGTNQQILIDSCQIIYYYLRLLEKPRCQNASVLKIND